YRIHDTYRHTTLYAIEVINIASTVADGTIWKTALPNLSITALAIDPQTPTTLYAGTRLGGPAGVFKSTDGGMSWSAVLADHQVHTLAIDPLMPTTLYAGTDHLGTPDGVLKSTDGGISWSAFNTGLNNLYV